MDRQSLLQKISQVDFYCLDLHLYLNTHPCDKDALNALNYMGEESKRLHQEYEKHYGPLSMKTPATGDYFNWINEPWPWEQKFNNN